MLKQDVTKTFYFRKKRDKQCLSLCIIECVRLCKQWFWLGFAIKRVTIFYSKPFYFRKKRDEQCLSLCIIKCIRLCKQYRVIFYCMEGWEKKKVDDHMSNLWPSPNYGFCYVFLLLEEKRRITFHFLHFCFLFH